MTATALSVASVHLTGINASRKKCGLRALTLVEVESEFADVNRPLRKAVAPRTNAGSADAMWTAIVGRLNASLPSRSPIAARTSPAPASTQPNRVVDWSSIATELNREAGLAMPARSRAR